jgi:hypothetical protein
MRASRWKTPHLKPSPRRVCERVDLRRAISSAGRMEGMMVGSSVKDEGTDAR